MKYKNLEFDISEEDVVQLVKVYLEIDDEFMKHIDISDHQELIYHMVLSSAVTHALKQMMVD